MADTCEEKLKKLAAEYEEFAYIVSHDLKAPVRAISNLAGWLEEDLQENLSEENRENLNLLKNRSARLTHMIEALLEFSRVNRRHLETEEINPEAEITNFSKEFRNHKPFPLTITGKVAPFKTYSGKLSFVLRELLTNAITFNQNTKPKIVVNLKEGEKGIWLEISDNGPGIPEEALPKVFTMFYTVQPKDLSETTGAGLAIINKIVNFVNGNITLKNRPEGGLEVTVFWPKLLPGNETT